MKHLSFFISAMAVVAVGVSCEKTGGDDDGNNPYKPLELTTKSTEFVQKGNSFSIEFIDRINASATKDYIISPLSMQFLLGMVLDGAEGMTADEICSVLGYGKGEKDAVDEYCLSMLQQLPVMDKKTKLNIANALFADNTLPVLDSYQSLVGKYYQAEIANLDFSDGTNTLKTINEWCSRNTDGMIPKVLDELCPDIPLYLFNAMYFKGEWKEKFKKSFTADETFTDESGNKAKVKMMKQNEVHGYTENEVFQAVSMSYGNTAFSMVALLPKTGYKVTDVIASLRESGWDDVRSGMYTCDVDLWLPRFETSFGLKLNDFLADMGMPLAFDKKKADFSALSDVPLYLDYVQQDAIIKVDEEGTEAAVVSHAGFGMPTSPGPDVIFHADHPFLYLITEKSTGAILFAGRYSGK